MKDFMPYSKADQLKNDFEIQGDTTVIYLKRKNGDVLKTLIDTEDLPKVAGVNLTWRARKVSHMKDTYYAKTSTTRKGKNIEIILARFIMNAPKGMVVDHINHDTLDNRKQNLRIITKAQNNQNKKGFNKRSKTKVRGVYFSNYYGKYLAQIYVNKKNIYVGLFTDLKEAEKAVRTARDKHMKYNFEGDANG